MQDQTKYPIQYVSRATGLKPHVLRSWESRYSAICPERTDTNRRLYTKNDIERLQLIKEAISHGHSISQVAPLSDEALISLNNKGRRFSEGNSATDKGQPVEGGTHAVITRALDRVRQFDPVGLEKVLDGAAVSLPRTKYIHNVVQPLFATIGKMWSAGELKIINERLATLAIRSQLLDMLRSNVVSDFAPRLIVAAPVGQWHETGCLIVALTAAESGWRPMYFGPNLPAEEIAAAAQNTKSKVVALSIGHRINPVNVVREVRKLRDYCGNQAKIIVGGYGAFNIMERLDAIGVKCILNLKDFANELEAV